MSGGSYNYVEHVELYAPGNLRDMADRLEQLYPGSRAALHTRRVIILIEAAAHFATDELRETWHAVEWKDSFDWGMDQLDEAIDAYEKAQRAS